MTAAVDLRPLIAAVEAEMVDACTIRRGRPGPADDVLDPVTLQLAEIEGELLYAGKCLLSGGGSGVEDRGGDQEQVGAWQLRIPLAGNVDVQRGDVVTITVSRWHPGMVGTRFFIRDEATGTLSPARRLALESRR
jgi:hypothetical protein